MVKRITASLDFIFQKIAAGKPAGLDATSGKSQAQARDWYRKAAAEITQIDAVRAMTRADQSRAKTGISQQNIGQMFMFWYDAKLKAELPYWDRLPLIFPIEIYKDGFLGVNLHYLPPNLRAALMDALYTAVNNNKHDKTTQLRISYAILKGAAKYRGFKPCVKRYLNSHVRSKFIKIDTHEWDLALLLPTERFEKQRKQVVWAESTAKISGR